MARRETDKGQASVELVAVLPVVAVLMAMLWQATVAGQAVWLIGTAARAAARAAAVGGDPREAARHTLPGSLRRGLRTVASDDGTVRVWIHIPSVIDGGPGIATISARARFRSQEG